MGRSDFDRTHVLIFNGTYDIPWLRGGSTWTHRLLGNWALSGIFQAQSGTPFSIRNNVDYAGVGAGSGNQFWNLVGDPNAQPGTFTDSAVWFNKNAFAQPGQGTIGLQPRNILRQSGFWDIDGGVRKDFRAFEQQLLQFRFEVFNVVNHPNWGGASASPTSGSFGTVTSKSGNRAMQLALKYIF